MNNIKIKIEAQAGHGGPTITCLLEQLLLQKGFSVEVVTPKDLNNQVYQRLKENLNISGLPQNSKIILEYSQQPHQ